MRNLYVHQLEHKASQDAIEVLTETEEESVEVVEEQWISVKKFFQVTRCEKRETSGKAL